MQRNWEGFVTEKSGSPSITLNAQLVISYPDGSFARHSIEEKEAIRIESRLADLVHVAQLFQRETK